MDVVMFNAGNLSRYGHVSEEGQMTVFVHFCPNCGIAASLTFERWPEVRGIARGRYNNPNAVVVSSHRRC